MDVSLCSGRSRCCRGLTSQGGTGREGLGALLAHHLVQVSLSLGWAGGPCWLEELRPLQPMPSVLCDALPAPSGPLAGGRALGVGRGVCGCGLFRPGRAPELVLFFLSIKSGEILWAGRLNG